MYRASATLSLYSQGEPTMTMVYCRSCSAQIHETAPTCPKCGAPQTLDHAAPIQEEGGFFYWALEPLRRYAQFKGRARRKEYWFFFILSSIFQAIMGLIDPTLYMLASLALLIPSLSVAVRRYHDTDRRGWWMLVPIANLIFLCLDSTQGENRFGSSPKYA
jgi:uncharacterized membrane protein YhaH (DUF805 family)